METGSAITWKYPSCILKGDDSVGEFYSVAITNNRQQADTGTKMLHVGRNTRSRVIAKGVSAGRSQSTYRGRIRVNPMAHGARNYTQCDSLLIGDECAAHTVPYIEGAQPERPGRARGHDIEGLGGPALLLPPARHPGRRSAHPDRQRLLPRGAPGTADGVRRGSPEARRHQPRRQCGMTMEKNAAMTLLSISDLRVAVDGKEILKGINLSDRHGRGPCHHGPQRIRQVDALPRAWPVATATR